MPRLGSRLLALTAAVAFAAAVHAAATPAATRSFFVGAEEDAFLWGNSQQTASVARTLGLKSVRVTLQWKPGESQVPASFQLALQRMVLDSWGIRVVASVYGRPQDAPRTDDARAQYCSFVADLLRDNPEIDDVAIWDDPNDGTFWTPQFDANGKSVAPADYEALLATCYDAAHAVRTQRERDRGRPLQELRHAGRLHARRGTRPPTGSPSLQPPSVRAAGRSRSSTRLATSRIPRAPRNGRGRSTRAPPRSRSATIRR